MGGVAREVIVKRQLVTTIIWTLVTVGGTTTCLAVDLGGEVERLRATIEALIKRIEVQDQRIAVLEDALKNLAGSSSRSLATTESGPKQPPEPLEGWKNPANWMQIKQGMTQSQVRQILGPPTLTEGSFWRYEGYVPASGNVSGYVLFGYANRVMGVDKPVFSGR